ncbi:ATP binding cassette protein 1 [Actinidia rufa]|uniref:ATP binding cassette protein 1 n=1 Tax=Actinidia rufa TaxID=165716 RepID=A0A7J0G699_9ERIC|nr:ATP binding cassette protein 1 [Actinidia rufa]
MASLLANGILSLSPQTHNETSKFQKGFSPKFETLKFSNPKNPNFSLFKVRAEIGYEPKTLDSDVQSSSSSGKLSNDEDPIQKFLKRDYKWGFQEEIDSFTIPKGLSEETVRLISSRKNEPDWMLEYRLNSFEKFLKLTEPKWSDNRYPSIDFQDICYYSEPTKKPTLNSLDEADPELIRTLIVADDRSFVEYLEGCTAPSYDKNQLHAAVVELYCAEGAEIKYSTVQNWYAGDEEGRGGIYNFVTKRGLCAGARSKISWTQVETGSAITWKYPSVILEGDDTVGEFYSVALTNNYQQADTGTKMIHKGKNTRSRIISKGISAGNSRNCYRGLVQVQSRADNARNSSQCDSMLIGDNAAANTYPYIQAKNPTARIEHEASTSKIGEDQLFYFQQRGIDYEKAMAAMISGFCRDVFNELPDEFGAEVNQLMSLKLEGSVG